MTATYSRPIPNTSLKASTISVYASGSVIPARYDTDAWNLLNGTLAQTPLSGVAAASGQGSLVSCTDGASGAWIAQVLGSVVHYASGGALTAYALPTVSATVGAVYASGAPYFLSSNGALTTISGGASAAVGSGFGAPSVGLAVSGTTLFTIIPGTPAIGTFQLVGSTSGSVACPITAPSCLAATSGGVAVGGWTFSGLGSGFTAMAIDPANNAALVGVASGTGMISAWGTTTAANTWVFTSSVSGIGKPAYTTWVPNGLYALASDPTNGTLYNFTYSLGTLAQWDTIALAGAGPLAMLSDSTYGLICRTAANQAVALTYSGSHVATGAAIAISAPSSIVYAASGQLLIGCASGLALATISSGGVWSITATGSVGFTPTSLYVDGAGNAYCAATSGALGLFAVATSGLALVASGSFTGSAVGIVYQQGQTIIADGVNSILRGYGPTGSTYSQYATAAAPAGLSALALNAFTGAEQDLFAAGSAATWQYSLTAPYTPSRVRQGALSVYASGSWTSIALAANVLPETMAWNPSGNVSVSMLANTLSTYTSGLSLVSSGVISQQFGIGQTIPIGISALLWEGGPLYGSTGLNDSVVQVQ